MSYEQGEPLRAACALNETMNTLNPLAIYTLPTGTGLGLAITQSIIEEHKGKIKVTSTIGEGTEFTIQLPISVDG